MRTYLGPPVCVLILEVVLFERLINDTNRSFGTSTSVLIIEVVLIEGCPHLQVPVRVISFR